ncbi:MAG: CHAT domain-containing protein [Leptolyngbyaceae cyanobacterium]
MLLPPAPPAISALNLPPILATAAPVELAVSSETAITLQPILSPESARQPQFSPPRLAQAVIPNADGTGTVVTPDGSQIDITGGQLSGDGANLFHSFQEFGLTAEQGANFIASPEIQNILSSVNGGNASIINGLLQVSGSQANLYLINPAGVIFGPHGAIDLTGSFTATTANQIGFGDTWLDVQNPTAYEALVGSPDGFAFAENTAGTVLNQGNLTVEAGESITLLGGEVINLGTIEAPGGTITLAAVPGENRVRISQENQLLSLEITPQLTETGQLALNPLALPELLTGSALANPDLTVVQNADGTVRLESPTAATTLELGSVIASGEIVTAGEQGGQIYLLGQQVSLLNAEVDASGQLGGGDIRIGGDFQGQGALPRAQVTTVDAESQLAADALQAGDGGTVIVWADDTTRFLGQASVQGRGSGSGGLIEISGAQSLQFSGTVNALAASGRTGTLLLDPTNIEVVAAGADTGALTAVDEFGDPDLGANNTTRIDVGALNAALANVVLQATNDITFSTDVTTTTGVGLTAIANNNIFLNSNLTTNFGAITLQADADNSGSGSVIAGGGTTLQTQGGPVTVMGAGLQLGAIDTSAVIPGAVSLMSTSDITFDEIAATTTSADPGGDVSLVADGTVQGLSAGITINAQGATPGTVTIQHDGGPTNAAFTIGDAAVNGTAGAIAADSVLTSGTFNVQPTGGTDNPSPAVTITSVNTPPTLSASQQLATVVDQPLDFTVADLNPTVADANSDITTLEIVSIPSGTLFSNGVPVQPGDAIALTDSLQFIPPADTSGTITAFTLRASDGVADSAPVAITVTIAAPETPESPESPDVTTLDPTLGTAPPPLPDLLATEQIFMQGLPLAQSPQLEELSVLGMVLPEPSFLIGAAIAISAGEDGIFPPSAANAPAANVPSLDIATEPREDQALPQPGGGVNLGQLQEPGEEGETGDGGDGGGGEDDFPVPEAGDNGSAVEGESPPLTDETEPSTPIPETDSGSPAAAGETTTGEAATGAIEEDGAAEPVADAESAADTEANTGLRNCQETVETIENAAARDRTEALYEALIDCYEANLATATQQGDTRWMAYSLTNLAIAHFVIGDYLTALDLHQQQLDQAIALGDATQEGIVLGGLGATYAALGDYATAIDFYERSLSRLPIETAPQWKALTYRNLGNAYFAEKDYEQAAQHQLTSLDIARGAGDRYGEMQAYGNLGSTRAIQGRFAEAIAYHEQGLTLATALANPLEAAQILLGLSTVYAYQQNYDQAYRYSQEARAISQQLGSRLGEGVALTNAGNALLYLNRLTEAEQTLFTAIELWESLRAGLGTNDAFKVSIFETQLAAYNNLQEVLVTQDQPTVALEVSERSRARAFVELLARGQGPANAAGPVSPPSLARLQQIAAEQNATLVEYAIIRDQAAEPPHAASVQNPVEPRDAQLYIWVVSPDGAVQFRSVSLPTAVSASSVADLVVETRAALTGRDPSLVAASRGLRVVPSAGDRPLQPGDFVRRAGDLPDIAPYEVVSVSPDGQTVTVRHPDFVLPDPALPVGELSRVEPTGAIAQPPLQQLHDLLIDPIAELLPTDPNDLVIFVPQEHLFLVPFAALQDEQGTYLIEQHTLAITPSIQVLELTSNRAAPANAAAPNALVVGNPSPMPGSFVPLPNAETEAATVADLLSATPLLRDAATEAEVKAALAEADIIHLATHGEFNSTQPLQGALALAPDAQNDGFLTAAEILEQPLQASLAILSACDTGRGRITGDGVIGLSRSFMATGVPQVVVSLWQVPDQQTADLMIDFHTERLKQGNTPQALREAMLSALATYPNDPALWAAFVQVGSAQ